MHKWHVGRKEQDAKSRGGKARLDRWLETPSVSVEGEPQEKGDMSWEAFCFIALLQCRAFWQPMVRVSCCLECEESLSRLT